MAISLRYKRIAATAALILGVIVAVVFYYFNDPAANHMAPRCAIKTLTGYDCPGCGFQRAFHSMLHGDIRAAWGFNPMLFFMIPLAAFYALIESMPGRFVRLRRILLSPAAIIATALIIIAWWIIRNI